MFIPHGGFPRFAVFILLSAALMVGDYRYDGLDKVRYYLGAIVDPIYYAASLPAELGDRLYHGLTERERLMRENETLRRENLLLHSQLQEYAVLENENRRLSELLNSSYKESAGDAVVAKIIATNYSHFRQHVVLDKGGNNDVYVGQPILGTRGLMGQIVTVRPLSATGMLISDPDHAMLIQVSRSGLRALAVGTGDPRQLRLDYVPLDANVKKGDLIVTSNLDGRYPPDYPVGEVSYVVKHTNDNFASVGLKPFAELEGHREVLLTWKVKSGAEAESD